MLLRLLLQTYLVLSVLATPLRKRNSPRISSIFDAQQRQQVHDAHDDALVLARTVQTVSDAIVDPILAKWFKPSDKVTVMGMLDQQDVHHS